MNETLNADFAERAFMDTNEMDWQASPSATVWRKRLDLVGGEVGRVTSIVRYDAGSSFPEHDHPRGEEILVIEGVFSDEHGDYPAGAYLLNPPGFRHAPFSREGCVIFVKLRQYAGEGREHVFVDTRRAQWQDGKIAGVTTLPLYGHPDHPERMSLVRFTPGTHFPAHDHPGGEEIFVLDGGLEDEHGRCPAGTWTRAPVGSSHAPFSKEGCTLYVKSGHLKALAPA